MQTKTKVNLFFNWYEAKTPGRQHEIEYCLEKNRELFDRVILYEGRPTFTELFEMTKKYPDDINCFCNSDIYFTDLDLLHKINRDECFALTRYNVKPDNGIEFFNRIDSQDAWVFRGTVKENIKADFTMGMWGCDNRLAHELWSAGYDVINPSLSIKTIHLHQVDDRVYTRSNTNTVPPPYLTLTPTKI